MTSKEAINFFKFRCTWSTEEKEAVDLAISALEKQVPMIVTDIHVDEYYCPNCGSENAKDYCSNIGDCYCPNCGQKLKWADRKENDG